MANGFEKCPTWLKLKYRQAVNFICQGCYKNEDEVGTLEAHRIKQGNEGGLYTVVPLNHVDNNIKVLCKECHKKYHQNNYLWCKSKQKGLNSLIGLN